MAFSFGALSAAPAAPAAAPAFSFGAPAPAASAFSFGAPAPAAAAFSFGAPAPAASLFGAPAPSASLFGAPAAVAPAVAPAPAAPVDAQTAVLQSVLPVLTKYLPVDGGPITDIRRLLQNFYRDPECYKFRVRV